MPSTTLRSQPCRAPQALLRAIAGGSVEPHTITQAEFFGLRAHCRRQAQRWQDQIKEEVTAGRSRIARKEQHQFLRALPVRVLAAISAWEKAGGRPAEGAASFDRIWRIAEALHRLDKPSTAHLTKKMKLRANAHRPICAFRDIEDRARQHLAVMAVTPFASIHPAQFAWRRGRSAACESLHNAMRDAGREGGFAQIDIKNFYGSISHAWLEENLPLSEGMIRSVIHTGGMRIIPFGRGQARPTCEDIQEVARRGIPQGSAASPLIAEIVVADVLRGLADRLPPHILINYSDNVAIVLRGNAADWPAFMELLRDAFATHPAGPFHLTMSQVKPLTHSSRFLGYSWVWRDNNPVAYVEPEHLEDRILQLRSDILFMPAQKLRGQALGYRAAFSLCRVTRSACDELLEELRTY
jgi:RNA-directed DNA polymerase